MRSSASARRCRSIRTDRGRQSAVGEQPGAVPGLERELDRLANGELGEERRGLERAARARAARAPTVTATTRAHRGCSLRRCSSRSRRWRSSACSCPAPLVPINPTISSAPTSKETSWTAVLPPNRTVMLRHRERGYAGRRRRTLGCADRRGPSVFFSTAGAGPRRRSTRPRSASRAEYAICTRPPGKNRRSTSRPTLDVSSGTSWLLGKNAGRPITHSAPRIGPGDGAEAADHHDRHERAASR